MRERLVGLVAMQLSILSVGPEYRIQILSEIVAYTFVKNTLGEKYKNIFPHAPRLVINKLANYIIAAITSSIITISSTLVPLYRTLPEISNYQHFDVYVSNKFTYSHTTVDGVIATRRQFFNHRFINFDCGDLLLAFKFKFSS